MMDLLDRYLESVRRNLPARESADIIAELRDLLLDKAEEEEARTGTVDWSALLQDFGHPLSVAARYRKQQWLIGPELYPFYLDFLKVTVRIALVVVTLVAVVKAVLGPWEPAGIALNLLGALWWGTAATVGSMTIVFVMIERYGGGASLKCSHWKPTELPEVVDRQPSVSNSIFEVVLGWLILLWWVGVIPTPSLSNGEFRLEAAPIWATLFWPVTALLAGRLAYNMVVWLRPRWKAVRGFLGITTTVGGLIVAVLVFRAGRWIEVVSTGMDPAPVAGLQGALDLALRIAIVAIVVIWSVGILGELWKLTRTLREGRATA